MTGGGGKGLGMGQSKDHSERTDLSILLVDAGKVDPGDKVNNGRLVGIGLITKDPQAVDPVLVNSLDG